MKVTTAALAATLPLTACGSSDKSSTPSATVPTNAASSTTPSASTAPRASTTPGVTPTSKPTPKPKVTPPKTMDGRNLAACRHGNCQVLVSDGVTTIKFRGGSPVISGTLVIRSVGIDDLVYELTGDNFVGGSGELSSINPTTYGLDATVLGGQGARSDDPPGLTVRAPWADHGVGILDLHLV